MNETTITSLIYLAGTIFVSMAAIRFFNDPPFEPEEREVKDILHADPKIDPVLPKYVTERTRYHIYLSTFVFFTLLLYFFISLIFPSLITSLLGFDIKVSVTVALVLGTLAFMSFSKKLPFVAETLTTWKKDFHKRAKIPDKAMYVFDSLRFSEVNKATEAFRSNLKEILEPDQQGKVRADIDADYFLFDKDRLERKWARLVYLIHATDKWGTQSQFTRHLKTESLRWLQLRCYYQDKLLPMMVRYKQSDLDEATKSELKEKIDATLVKLYWLITLLLFMANKAAEDPCVHLKGIGWIVTPDKYFKFSYRHVIFTGTIVLVAILLGAASGAGINFYLQDILPDKYAVSPKKIWQWVIYGTPMFVLPLVITLSLKRFLTMHDAWPVRRPEDRKETFAKRPWEIYVAVSFAAYVATFTLLASMAVFAGNKIDKAVEMLSVYCGLAFITAMFICYLIDSPSPGWERNWKYYIVSIPAAIVQGSLNVLLVAFAIVLFNEQQTFNVFELADETKGRLIVHCVTAFVIGIAMYMTSRMGSKQYERREGSKERSTQGWETIVLDTIQKRVEVTQSADNQFEIIADDELQAVADVGDLIHFLQNNEVSRTGSVEAVAANRIRVAVTA